MNRRVGFFCEPTLCYGAGLFCEYAGLFCEYAGLFCEHAGLFCAHMLCYDALF